MADDDPSEADDSTYDPADDEDDDGPDDGPDLEPGDEDGGDDALAVGDEDIVQDVDHDPEENGNENAGVQQALDDHGEGVDDPLEQNTGVQQQDNADDGDGGEVAQPEQNTGVQLHAVAAEMDAKYGPRESTHNLRPRRLRSYAHLHTTHASEEVATVETVDEDDESEDTPVDVSAPGEADAGEPLATPQMSMKRGIKVFGQGGVDAVKKEMQQLHDRIVMQAKNARDRTPEEKKQALAYLMFLKRKRTGDIKGRGCADGRKQRAWTDKDEATSPTIATEAVFLTAVIDAYERRDAAIVDVPGAFMQADMDELVLVRFTGVMVDLLLEIDYEMYSPFVVYEGNEKVLYDELLV
jgi:hypothetical protein